MICPTCSVPNRDDAKFCKRCGHPLHSEAPKMPEVAAVSQTAAPAQERVEWVHPADDPNLAPTQIISQQQMKAFHQHLWQKDKQQAQAGGMAVNEEDMPTLASTRPSTQPLAQTSPTKGAATFPAQPSSPAQNEPPQEVADMPTVLTGSSNSSESEAIPIPPPPPHAVSGETTSTAPSAQTTMDEETSITPPPPPMPETAAPSGTTAQMRGEAKESKTDEEDKNVEARFIAPKEEDQGVTQTSSDQSNQPEQSQPSDQPQQDVLDKSAMGAINRPLQNSGFPVLAVGRTLVGRYEITQVVSEDPQEHIYEVIDHQGYQHCWNCGSEENKEGDEFCIACGAALLDASYYMHEYTASEHPNADEGVFPGEVVNTFVDQGHTYVIEQMQGSENAFPNGVHLIAACDSDAGNIRRSDPNEDSTLVLMLERVHESKATPVGVFIVADGLGGHENGQLASHMAIGSIAERIVRELLAAPLAAEKSREAGKELNEDALVSLLQGTVEDANAAICQMNQRDKTDMGSTLTGFMIIGDYAYIVNIGDSRTYMVRSEQIYQLTTDHSLVGQLVAGGLISPDDVYTHPQRSQIYRSLGDKLNVQIDIFKQQLHPGDILLSCSDGLWEMVRDPQIESILNNAPDPQAACTQLIEAANTNGGEDNVSVVVVFVR